jgi:hypothetical protein
MMGSSRVALRLEPLNDRVVPSVTVVQDGGTMTIKGDAHANSIEIHDGGTPAGLTVTVDGVDQGLSGLEVTKVVVRTGGGADTVSYTLEGDYAATARTVEVWLGNGDDTFTADLGHAVGADSSLTLLVRGGNGKDNLSVTGTGGSVAGTLDVQLYGQNGMDVISFNYAGDVSGGLKVNVDGGNAKDDLSVHYAGLVDGSLELTAKGGNGVDTFAGDLSVTGGAGTVTAHVLGGNGKDDMDLSLTVDPAATLSADVSVDGGRGKDTITTTGDVTVVDAAKN